MAFLLRHRHRLSSVLGVGIGSIDVLGRGRQWGFRGESRRRRAHGVAGGLVTPDRVGDYRWWWGWWSRGSGLVVWRVVAGSGWTGVQGAGGSVFFWGGFLGGCFEVRSVKGAGGGDGNGEVVWGKGRRRRSRGGGRFRPHGGREGGCFVACFCWLVWKEGLFEASLLTLLYLRFGRWMEGGTGEGGWGEDGRDEGGPED